MWGTTYAKMLVHNLTPLEVRMVEVNYASLFVAMKEISIAQSESIEGHTQ